MEKVHQDLVPAAKEFVMNIDEVNLGAVGKTKMIKSPLHSKIASRIVLAYTRERFIPVIF